MSGPRQGDRTTAFARYHDMRAFIASCFLTLICLAFSGVANGQTPGRQEGDRGAAARLVLNEAVADTAFPGAVAVAGRGGEVLMTVPAGRYGIDDSRLVVDSTVYDLASVTKVVSMTTAIMLLVADGVLEIDGYVQSYLPRFSGGGHQI